VESLPNTNFAISGRVNKLTAKSTVETLYLFAIGGTVNVSNKSIEGLFRLTEIALDSCSILQLTF
jgi:hypothetical protein